MTYPAHIYATLDDWITHEAIPFSVDSPRTFSAAIDKVIASLGDSVELLGFGEALHGGEDILILRDRLFQYLVEALAQMSHKRLIRLLGLRDALMAENMAYIVSRERDRGKVLALRS